MRKEINKMRRYSVWYKGCRYCGDTEEWNHIDYSFSLFNAAMEEYNHLKEEGFNVYLRDNEYDIYYEDEEWV